MADSQFELALRIVVDNPPRGVTFQVQRGKRDLVPPVGTTADALVFEFTVRVGRRPTGEPNFLGPFAQGPPAARFVYINSGTLAGQAESCWSRRAKVPLTGITWPLVESARTSQTALEAHIQGAGCDGSPTCASVRLLEPGWRVTHAGHRRGAK
jgi:hypothetical protein